MNQLDVKRCCDRAVSFVQSLGWVDVRIASQSAADLAELARLYSADELNGLKGDFVEVRLLCKWSPGDASRILRDATSPDVEEVRRFLDDELEILVVCDTGRVVYHAWPKIDFD